MIDWNASYTATARRSDVSPVNVKSLIPASSARSCAPFVNPREATKIPCWTGTPIYFSLPTKASMAGASIRLSSFLHSTAIRTSYPATSEVKRMSISLGLPPGLRAGASLTRVWTLTPGASCSFATTCSTNSPFLEVDDILLSHALRAFRGLQDSTRRASTITCIRGRDRW